MILVIAEQRGDRLNPASWEAIAAGQQMGAPVTVAIAGADVQRSADELAGAEVTEVIALEHEALGAYTPDGFASALVALVADLAPTWVVFAHTYQARDFVPIVAAQLDRALVTDCTAVRAAEGALVFTRPMFRGKVAADVAVEGPAPGFVTVQAGAFRADAVRRGAAPAAVRRVAASVDPASIRQRPEPPFREARQAVDLAQAERIVAIGRGIKDRDHVALAESLASALDAELAASRPICDAGWLPMDRQIGSSGQTVAPKLYIAVGISGAIQHIVGMKGARTIVAINKDPEAPIFEIADYGIAGDLFEIVPAMIAELKKGP